MIPIEGIGTLLVAQGLQTSPPQERQLCLSLASCAALFDVLAHVKRLAQQQLLNEQRKVRPTGNCLSSICNLRHLPCVVFVKGSPPWWPFGSCSCCLNLQKTLVIGLGSVIGKHVSCQTYPSQFTKGSRHL